MEGVGAHVGPGGHRRPLVDVNSASVWVAIESDADYGATLDDIRDGRRRVHGVRSDVVTYTDQRIRDVGALREGENNAADGGLDVLTGVDRPLTSACSARIRRCCNARPRRCEGSCRQVDGVVDPRIVRAPLQPTLEIEVDLAKARRRVKPGDVRRAEATLLQGIQVGSVFQKQKVFDVMVQGAPCIRRDVDAVRNLLIDRPGGGHVRLGQVADVRIAETPEVISAMRSPGTSTSRRA